MTHSKYLSGVAEEAGASGVVPVTQGHARPQRRSATGTLQTDGPYDFFGILGLTRMSAQVSVDVGTATVFLEVTNGDPSNEDTPWFELADTGALDGSTNLASDMLTVIDLPYRFARLRWGSATGSPTIRVDVVAEG